MKKIYPILVFLSLFSAFACNSPKQNTTEDTDKLFTTFEDNFLDAYWKQHPSSSIFVGYGKYYDALVIPDSASFAQSNAFSQLWIDSLNKFDIQKLSDNNKISLNIIKNQLESDIWYNSTFKVQEWDASIFNIAGECDYIINQPYAPLDERLKTLSKHIESADAYYKAALAGLREPTKEHMEMALSLIHISEPTRPY